MRNVTREILTQRRRVLTFEYDDWPRGSRDALAAFDWLKKRFPYFRATVFAIPNLMGDADWTELRKRPWIDVGSHGFRHRKRECSKPRNYRRRLHWLDHVSRKPWIKLFKAPWYGYSADFFRELTVRGFAACVRSTQNWEMPAPADMRVWSHNDAIHATRVAGCRDALLIQCHPVYRSWKACQAKRTELSARNLMRWLDSWRPDDRWSRVVDLVRPATLKISLGCGPHVWDSWDCLDYRPQVADGIIRWDARAQQLPYLSCRADIIFTSHLFNYLDYPGDYEDLLLECWRVLRAGGVLRLAEDATDSGYAWRQPGRRHVTGTIRSLPTRARIEGILNRIGFSVALGGPTGTLSPHVDVLAGNTRTRRWRWGQKYYLEATKPDEGWSPNRANRQDPRGTRRGRWILPPE